MSAFPKRGEVYFVDLRSAQGSEQQGIRPALIVSNNLHNQFSPVVSIVPITHTIPKRRYPQNVGIPAGLIDELPSTIYCGQIQTIDRRRFADLWDASTQAFWTRSGLRFVNTSTSRLVT
jgi:mRNA interferase MazF